MAVVDIKNASLKLLDGTAVTPQEIELKVGTGTLSFTRGRTVEYMLSGGTLDEVRDGDEVPLSVSIDLMWEFLKSPTGGFTPYDAITGDNALWLASDPDACRGHSVDIECIMDPSTRVSGCTGDIETYIFPSFRYESIDGDLRAGTLAVAGKCNVVAPTITRVIP
jgi:hypothetical protein